MVKDNYLVSVRLMTFNHAPFIAEAIDGILMQDVDFNVEIVVGDDFSTDDTLNIVRSYSDTSNMHFKILDRQLGDNYYTQRQIKGRLFNFSDIIANCQGKYIALLDGDDYWTSPIKLKSQVGILENDPSLAGCFHETAVLKQDGTHGKVYGRKTPEIVGLADTLAKVSPFHTSSFMFRNSVLEIPDWFFEIFSADMALFALVAQRGDIKKWNSLASIYRDHSGGITKTAKSRTEYLNKRILLYRYFRDNFDEKYHSKLDNLIVGMKQEKKSIFYKRYFSLFGRLGRLFSKS